MCFRGLLTEPTAGTCTYIDSCQAMVQFPKIAAALTNRVPVSAPSFILSVTFVHVAHETRITVQTRPDLGDSCRLLALVVFDFQCKRCFVMVR
jgi:hypothetical protein